MNNNDPLLRSALQRIRDAHPLVHCISNIVTAGDCANLALAVGASPIMAQAPEEMADITHLADALVLNTGTPGEEKYLACERAFAAALQKQIPVILDPVGVGASPWRLGHIRQILKIASPSVFRVNYSEAQILLYGADDTAKAGALPLPQEKGAASHPEHGVDTSPAASLAASEEIARALAETFACTVLLSGPVDIITDGRRMEHTEGGSRLTRQITGAGCMLSVLCGCFAAVCSDSFEAALFSSLFWKSCAAQAERSAAGKGLGSFHTELFNAAGQAQVSVIRS